MNENTNHQLSVVSRDRRMGRGWIGEKFRRLQTRDTYHVGQRFEGRQQIQRTRNLRIARGQSRGAKPINLIVVRRLSPLEVLETVDPAYAA